MHMYTLQLIYLGSETSLLYIFFNLDTCPILSSKNSPTPRYTLCRCTLISTSTLYTCTSFAFGDATPSLISHPTTAQLVVLLPFSQPDQMLHCSPARRHDVLIYSWIAAIHNIRAASWRRRRRRPHFIWKQQWTVIYTWRLNSVREAFFGKRKKVFVLLRAGDKCSGYYSSF